jgi:hypothetical protein
MFKSAKTKASMASAMKSYRVDRHNVSPSDESYRVPSRDELPTGILQMTGKLKSCK